MRIRHRGFEPVVDESAYVAPNATLVGQVRVGPRARVMYGAVLDAEDGAIEVGECSIICENAVLRGGVSLGDHVFVGPQATLLGCRVERCAYLATGVTILQEAEIGAGGVVAIGAAVHARSRLGPEEFLAPYTVRVGDEAFAPGDPGLPEAIEALGFARVAFGVDAGWTDRIRRYERIAEVRSAQFAAHADDEMLP
ncbi:gamma carbonic anhydrase family protein [Nonomuraea sp. NPDC050547]|uniref:gamma carbonic anhydrase family protein n=1 Tax=unclassified Nonomuraea TaxID=2593643 RepID=UPI0037BA6996